MSFQMTWFMAIKLKYTNNMYFMNSWVDQKDVARWGSHIIIKDKIITHVGHQEKGETGEGRVQ